MKNKNQLNLRHQQTLRLANQVRFFLELLPLTHLELKEKIEEALEENPALEIKNEEPEENPEILPSSQGDEFSEFYYEEDEEKLPPEALVPYEPEPREMIKKVLLPNFQEEEKSIVEAIVDYLDPKGFLDEESSRLIARELGVSEEKVEEIRKKVMKIPPYGLGARDPIEAMQAQLSPDSPPLVKELLNRDNLELLKARKYEELASRLGCSMQDLKEALAEVKGLNPFPGSYFFRRAAEPILVDMYLVEENGDLRVKVEDGELPPLRISPFYLKILEDPSAPEDLKKYARAKIRAAQWFLSALSKRKETLRKTAEYIVQRQRDFFKKGYNPEYLKPLNLRDVASAVGVHESTVSRIVSSRFISTPRGTYRLKFFFPAPSGKNGEVSSARIQAVIKKLIENEPKDSPYSDEELAELLKRRGINISRRTVAKYRKEMGIENAGKRKRKYSLEVL